MPLKKCSKDGKSGYKWGDQGKCYTGPGARKKALKQGRAIEANKFAKSAEDWDVTNGEVTETLRIVAELINEEPMQNDRADKLLEYIEIEKSLLRGIAKRTKETYEEEK